MHVVVEVTEELLSLFEARRVFHGLGQARRWRVRDRLALSDTCRLEPYSNLLAGHDLPLVVGAFTYSHSPLKAFVSVGRYGSLGAQIAWLSGDHPVERPSTSPMFYETQLMHGMATYFEDARAEARTLPFPQSARVLKIGHDVWIGDGAMIRRGVTIGDGAVIGARSLVLDDVPPYAVVHGSPARVSRMRFPEDQVARFQRAAWWRFRPEVLQQLPQDNPAAFLDQLEERVNPPVLTGAQIVAAGRVLSP
jgi:hypothetical protein